MDVWIRPATAEDLARVLEIESACETAPHWSEAEYRRIVSGEGSVRRCLRVAGLAESVIGFAVGAVVAGVGELESVAVHPAIRRCGAGTALCAAVLAWCRAEGAEAVELEVRAASDAARRLYEGLGWIETGRRRAYYEAPADDAVLMRLELNPSERPRTTAETGRP
jgi:ribosomal-protein-alanine N-acetyltransferase